MSIPERVESFNGEGLENFTLPGNRNRRSARSSPAKPYLAGIRRICNKMKQTWGNEHCLLQRAISTV
ncbi:hypothetical protein [Caballeronia novacaledonica]|uniref:hypothetical protein n=1 Tax=Caballeronia novacaledonica TaxID=1544861 RepID=UPI0011B1C71C|nr:hypothetical protein [Caballeronia novacaledonica]